mgnify:CR=1 FL=1
MLKRIRIVRVRPWGVCTGVISTVGVLYQIGQLSLIFSLVIGKATIIVNIPEVLCWILKLFLGDSADVGYTVDDSHHIRIDIQFHDDKTLFLETGEKEGKVKKKDGK